MAQVYKYSERGGRKYNEKNLGKIKRCAQIQLLGRKKIICFLRRKITKTVLQQKKLRSILYYEDNKKINFIDISISLYIFNVPNSCLSIRESNPVALKALFSVSSGVFLLVIRKYYCVEETPDFWETKAFRVLRSFKMSYFCRYKEKNEAMLSPCEAF